ncbi:adenylosuccinate lyase [Candidatus Daviesbacteria bacterium RIFCSPHIGHO2_01_FULL_41_45]|uniref:Adenylosuccinate lyase n=2 Tax=Candidatus Yanofskyibacteriota TaxID=1752733 RepID=A0A1F8G058_9BACT|nr:MAG: adenylosuccinate lyase [Candidatus Daviesbacteria bacterium RIFCSPHIGHO2_01_FULL_41_45]OGN18752.1 MAG: adenylosuccinate lyase [Candidatus Yanofskybacteria bacterium RIFCSPHIGHO2_12_FULL_45_19b]OGN32961.1 MAG: adenylosuccinate lyase [Candidatus Yanofskybacteria bacterium RIFCSPLOWO2_02_FULL_45_10]
MLKRYSRDQMSGVWSEKNKFFNWLVVEIAVFRARRRIGEMMHKIPRDLAKRIVINPEEINRIEKEETHHDVTAFLAEVSSQLSAELSSWLHRGLTSYDVVDTALSLQLRESIKVLTQTLAKLMSVVKDVALVCKYMPEVGRSHGIHAEPITFGVKLANWYSELERHHKRLQRLLISVSVGKISGAVGMYTLDPKIEELVCKELGLKPVIATQIIARDIVAEYMSTLAIIAATIGKISVNIRLLSQTEIREIMEPFSENQDGSSAMPHKKNPIGSENLSGLMRVVCANVQVAYENLATCWHERSLDNSGAERVIIADSSILLDYGMARLTGIIEKMQIYHERMLFNLNLTKGLIFSQEVMMLVAEKSGLPRKAAHRLVRDVALKCWETGEDFLETLLCNNSVMQFVNAEEVRACFNLGHKLRHVDYIFLKTFGE